MDAKDTMDNAGLSAAEREAIADTDDADALNELLDEEGDDVEVGEAEGDADVPEDSEADVATDDEVPADEPAAESVVVDAPVTFQPTPEPVDYADKIAALTQSLENGELELSAYLAQRDELMQARITANVTAEISRQTAEQLWQRENQRFFTDNPDYALSTSPVRFAAMQAAINIVAQNDANLTDSAMLSKAKDMVDREMGKPASAVPTPVTEKPRLVSSRDKLPPTLRNVPTEAPNEVGSGEFANIDRLSGMALEKAIAKMTPDQQARWAAG